MSHRHILAAVLAVGVASATTAAQAATDAHGVTALGKVNAVGVTEPATTTFEKVSSPAGKSVRTHGSDAGATRHVTASVVQPATTGVTIYAESNPFCAAPGTGTQASPYCSIQQAVNAAASGDTVAVESNVGYSTNNSFTVSTSGITVVGLGPQAWVDGEITISHATGVTIRDLMVEGAGPTSVQITGSSGITLDSDYIGGVEPASNGVSIDGTSSNITVSRSFVSGTIDGGNTITVAAGASHINLAADLVAGAGISATGVTDLNVTGDTIDRSCAGGVNVTGASTGVFVENDVFEDAGYIPGSSNLPGQSACTADGYGWAPSINVASTATAGTTADYNDFTSTAGDTTQPYSWSGADYATIADFTAATGQGTHDLNDPTTFTEQDLRPNEPVYMGLLPLYDSPAIGSANVSAPGELTSDYYGVSPYTTRGAVQFVAPNPNLAFALTAQDTSALSTTLSAAITGFSYGFDYNTGGGNPYPLLVTINWGDGKQTTDTDRTTQDSYSAAHTYARPGTYTITEKLDDGDGDSAVNSVVIETAGSDYTAYGPVRLLDTRNGTGGVSKPLTSTAPIKLKIAGNKSIPADVVAVAMNVTVTNVTGGGNVAVNPDGATPPGTSNLNFSVGQTVANLVIVPVGKDGYVSFTKQGAGSAAVIADVAGYYTESAASGYTTTSPTRILDTRNGTGGVSKPLTSTTPIKLQIAGNGSIPANVTAVAVNLTLTNSSGGGNVVAYPDGTTQPTASNLNYSAGQTVANAAIVPVTDGYIDLAKQGSGSVAMIVDVEGYFSPDGASAYLPVSPTRLFDSRKISNGKLPAGYAEGLGIDQDSNGNVLPGVTALMLNSTVTNVTGGGFLTVFPDNTNGTNGEPLVPNASNLNFGAGATVPNLTFATPGSNGVVDFYNGARSGSLDLIVDIFGYYQND